MRDEQLYLLDIVEAADAIERFLDGVSESDFNASELIQSAVVYKMTIIGEAASNISRETRSKYSEVVWKSVIGFRNIVVHGYFGVVLTIVWATAKISVPEIREQMITVLESEYPDFFSDQYGDH